MEVFMHNNISKILITEEQIINRVVELGKDITADYQAMDNDIFVVALLKGSIPFLGDITKRIDVPLQIEYMDVSSYHGGIGRSYEVKILKDLDTPVYGRDVLIVEDIIDTGNTLKKVVDLFYSRGAKTVKIVTMLDKPTGRQVDIEADYVGFVIPHEFVVGYGLDYEEYYRNIPYVGVLDPKVYTK